MDNQASFDVHTPSESLSIYDVLSPIRPVDQTQKKNFSPVSHKLLSHDIDKGLYEYFIDKGQVWEHIEVQCSTFLRIAELVVLYEYLSRH